MNLNKFSPDFEETPLHSSDLAKSVYGGSMGATTPQTFSQRRHIEGNRQQVRRYHDSLVVHGHHRNPEYHRLNTQNLQSRQPDISKTDKTTADPNGTRRLGNRQVANVIKPMEPRNFAEPSRRNYNPFQ